MPWARRRALSSSLRPVGCEQVLELIEDTQNVLDDVWKAEVPQNCQSVPLRGSPPALRPTLWAVAGA